MPPPALTPGALYVDVVTPVGRAEPFLVDAIRSVDEFATAAEVRVTHILCSDGPGLAWIAGQVETAGTRDNYRPVILDPLTVRQGPALARNRALRAGSAETVLTLDSDDMFVADEMAALYRTHRTHGGAWTAGRTVDVNADGSFRWGGPCVDLPDALVRPGHVRASMVSRGYFPFHCCATIVRRDAVEQAGGWDESRTFVRSEDVALWARITRAHAGWFSHRPVLRYRKHGDSLTSGSWAAPGGSRPDPFSDQQLDHPEPSLGSFEADLSATTDRR